MPPPLNQPDATAAPPYRIDAKRRLYPVVYVRGFAPTGGSREDAFYDAYYGFAETSVEKRQAPPINPQTGAPWYFEPDLFEGQLIRFIKEEGYSDAANGGLDLSVRRQGNPAQSLWVSRFYDADVLAGKVRDIEDHAEDLRALVCERIPAQLKKRGVDLGEDDRDYKVILIAHSMGGLVARCLIQNVLSKGGGDAKRWIHRLVTIGTPHRGIELGAVPDFLEEVFVGKGNALNAAIFRERRMRQYLKLPKGADLADLNGAFPPGRCLCLIGSDWASYPVLSGTARHGVGGFSDGLVKQDRAYVKGGYGANVHRAHSGRRGIVNSFESYQNVRRFLFGDTKVELRLEDIELKTEPPGQDTTELYDFEFALSVRGTGIYLHTRKQDPCENAMRYVRRPGEAALRDPKTGEEVTAVPLHTAFMDTALRQEDDPYSHFALAFRVALRRVKDGLFWDREYPERTIYSETLEVRVTGQAPEDGKVRVQYRWMSDNPNPDGDWKAATLDGANGGAPGEDGGYRLPLRKAATFGATLVIRPGSWPDETCEDA